MPTAEKGVAAIIAGSVIGSSIVLLLLLVFVLLVACISWYRKTKENKHILTVWVDRDALSDYTEVGDHSELISYYKLFRA